MKCPNCEIQTQKSIVDGKEHFQCPICTFNHCSGDTIIDSIYVWVAVDVKTGMESIIAFNDKGIPMPGISSKKEIAYQLLRVASKAKEETGMKMRLLKLDSRHIELEI